MQPWRPDLSPILHITVTIPSCAVRSALYHPLFPFLRLFPIISTHALLLDTYTVLTVLTSVRSPVRGAVSAIRVHAYLLMVYSTTAVLSTVLYSVLAVNWCSRFP
ncbi:hypothetical protein F5884DRAFT_219472 [Xylogone sp. PMI_703]|nr:hypothetical protein F5884DRAFT_219472 [Xylogone sp. PMI_703]